MITAEVEIDNNSDLDYFKALQPIAWPTPLLVLFSHPTDGCEVLIFLKVEPSLTDIIFLLVNKKTEEFKGYVWIKKICHKKHYKLVNYEFFIDEQIKDEQEFNYPINILGKIIRDGYDMEIEDKELATQVVTIAARLILENNIIKTTQLYFDSAEGVMDDHFRIFNTQYVKWFYNPNKYKFWFGRIANFLNSNYEKDI